MLVGGKARLLGFSAALPGRAADQLARALDGFEDERLVRLDDAGDGGRLLVFGHRQEAMAPPERRLQMDVGALGCLAQTDAVDQRTGIVEPFLA